METYYKGDEIKFAVNLEASGFSMSDDDFEIEVKSGYTSVKGYKGASASENSQDVVIFSETEGGETTWYVIVDTTSLAPGTMRVIATAHIVDANANDGVRNSIAVETLGKLIAP